ncbi:MAG: hypothetical protein COB36_10315 [Alphaproteobacteria bacterium]|nr:MAG: hypothetical protein COB36_10315 [Alphaproteobacteria bacterium]
MTKIMNLYPIEVDAECVTDTRTELNIDGFEIIIDEPKNMGGSGLGPMPLQMLMASYSGCINVIGHRVAKKLGIDLGTIQVKVRGLFDMRVMTGKLGDNPVFPEIYLDVVTNSQASQEELDKLASVVGESCPISVLLKSSGSKVIENWTSINEVSI